MAIRFIFVAYSADRDNRIIKYRFFCASTCYITNKLVNKRVLSVSTSLDVNALLYGVGYTKMRCILTRKWKEFRRER